MRVVLDTNIYIAAALKNSFSAEIIELVTRSNDLTAITSEEILTELTQKLKDKFHWREENIDYFVASVRKIAEVVEIKEKVSVILRDPEDNKILECAVSGEADLIVTLDQDLIKLKKFRGIGIVHSKTLAWTLPEYFKKRKA
ncbi:putative toxin-antitoxin system toxin component, PIN family [Candidatus Curtissbacteria bacterium]|nr:putative toxin-antitoxin system toxin component, PIN family [Candidatus Curtissbacteria bacterium]